MANDKMKQVLEYSVLYPGESQPDVEVVISNMSRNTIINMILVLTNLYSNKDLNNLSLFFRDKETLRDVIRRILRYCNPQADIIILPLQTALRMLRMAFAMLFHRSFTFIDRVGWGMNMNSRVQTLIDKFGISVKRLDAIIELPIDWNVFEQRLEQERSNAMLYLKNALK